MEVKATIDFDFADEKLPGGELEITNWDDQVKIVGAGPSAPLYLDRADLIRALCALDVASTP
jgi:hypothetical protein